MSSTVSIAAKSTESASVSDESPLWLQLQSELGGLRHACEHLSSGLLEMPHGVRHELSRLLGPVHTIVGSKYAPEDSMAYKSVNPFDRSVLKSYDDATDAALETALAKA
jgi:hypothetical protein